MQQPDAQRPRNFVITPDFPLGEGGAKSKAAANLEAIRTLKKIEAENRAATPEEQAVLARYVGWGGIPQAFAHPTRGVTAGWERVASAVEKALTPDEHAAARRSTQDAHYTSRTVVGGIYDALARSYASGRHRFDAAITEMLRALDVDEPPALVLAVVDGGAVAALSEGRPVRPYVAALLVRLFAR